MILSINRKRCFTGILLITLFSLMACGSDSKKQSSPAPGSDKVVTQTNPNQTKTDSANQNVQKKAEPTTTEVTVCDIYQNKDCPTQGKAGQHPCQTKGCSDDKS